MPKTLRFGIESLDKLIGSDGDDFGLSIGRDAEERPLADNVPRRRPVLAVAAANLVIKFLD